jgi:predicted phage terminase large subunit-like protein
VTCLACEEAGRDHEKVKQLILASPYYTGKYVCGFDWHQKGRFHKDIDKWYQAGLDRGYTRFLMIWPRGHLKTTRIISTIVNRILNNVEDRTLLRMSSAELSQDTCVAVAEIIMGSPGMKHFFPERMFQPGAKGVIVRNDELRVPRHGIYRDSTLEARGIDSKITGGHFLCQIFDDLIDETAIDSSRLQGVAVSRLQRSAPLYVEPTRDIWIIAGTRWPGEYYRWLLEDSGAIDRYWTVLLGCYVDDRYDAFMRSIGEEPDKEHGTPIWPEQFSMEDLAAIAVEMGPVNFTHQMLNLEVTEGTQRFKRDDFRHYKLVPGEGCVVVYPGQKTYTCPLSNLYITMTIDPATGEHERTDQSAITVCGFDRSTGIIFVLDAWQGRVLPNILIDKIINTAWKWKPHVVAPEDVSFQKTLKHFLKQEMQQRGIHFRIKPVAPGRAGKGRRIMDALQPFVANQQVHVLKSMDSSLVSELVAMQVVGGRVIGRSPNLADSLAYHSEFWRGQEVLMAQEDDDDIKLWVPESGPAYGLQCST